MKNEGICKNLGAFTCVGCLLFPAGWENREVVDVCTQASFYRLGKKIEKMLII